MSRPSFPGSRLAINGPGAAAAAIAFAVAAAAAAQEPGAAVASTPEPAATAPDARAAADKALAYLVTEQRSNGAWAYGACDTLHELGFAVETFYAWQVAAQALACMALMEADETPERRAALERGLRWLCTCRVPLRGNDWDNDAVWAWLYGAVATLRAAEDPRFAGGEWQDVLAPRGKEFLAWLAKNQVPTGGFGYYDDPPYTRRPKWATSFSTALVLPTLRAARDRGWLEDGRVLDRAASYVRRCQAPDGAYEYDLSPVPRVTGGEHINRLKGSLGRVQVCNWALFRIGDPAVSLERVREGVRAFFEHHQFLAVARMRPIPHEAYYANAGYFFLFGHYYCALAIELLPEDERAAWHEKLHQRLLSVQRPDGSFCDFLGSSYLVVAGTAFAAMALLAGA
jgi:hypothetical protein